jgi:tRNA A37 methylthiotransferase MiaB
MRRGYSKEAYLTLIREIRESIPRVTFSTDIISGFCHETEQEHQDTLWMMNEVKYDQAFMFSYSLREKTHAHRNYKDDVPEEEKKKRLTEVIESFRKNLKIRIQQEMGRIHLILIEGFSKNSEMYLFGKSDSGRSVTIEF